MYDDNFHGISVVPWHLLRYLGAFGSKHYIALQSQWEFEDPKMEVLYHIRPYFVGRFPYIGLQK